MHELSIQGSLAATGDKNYLASLASDGYEAGVGAPGDYAAHWHLGFVDVLFAPDGLLLENATGDAHEGELALILPRSWYRPVRLGAFWFAKFFMSPDDAAVGVPDKVESLEPTSERSALVVLSRGAISLPLYEPTTQQTGAVTLSLHAAGFLGVQFGNRSYRVVR